jgi:hypothetical protein
MELAQMEQMSASATLWQRWQNFISVRILDNTSLKCCTSSASSLSKWSTNLRAVFLPIPGSLANSFTAVSNKALENSIACKFTFFNAFNQASIAYYNNLLAKCRI